MVYGFALILSPCPFTVTHILEVLYIAFALTANRYDYPEKQKRREREKQKRELT